jgi:hypothetical protein
LLVAAGHLGDLILPWVFFAFALRGAAICLPLLAALFVGHRVGALGGVAIVAGPAITLMCQVLAPGTRSGSAGMAASLVVLLAAAARRASVRRRGLVTAVARDTDVTTVFASRRSP